MPYPSPDVLAAAAADLAGSHPLTIVTIPALLCAGRGEDHLGMRLPTIKGFGTKQERPVLESFRLRSAGKSPYLAVWQQPPVFIRSDYPGSTLQRLRTQDLLGQQLFDIAWDDGHAKRLGTALRPTAGVSLLEQHVKPVNRLSLALWLGRAEDLDGLDAFLDWFDVEYPLGDTDLSDFYPRDIPAYADKSHSLDTLFWSVQAANEEIVTSIHPIDSDGDVLDVPSTSPTKSTNTILGAPVSTQVADDDLRWTRDFCAHPLRAADIGRIVQIALDRLDDQQIVLPDAEVLVTRCVAALLAGHLILQGPPGTGKTTLARILAEAFEVRLLESTATSEWSPFHVVGGLRPGADNSLQPSYGKVADAALKCAVYVRADVTAEAEGDDTTQPNAQRPQGAWLLIDEFNRADIDKAVGSLYTVLSSCDAANLERSPIDLWFETDGRQQLWVPSRFRIIAAMNDLDTSFVNPISQGLTRRFQFITVGVPARSEAEAGISIESDRSLKTAYDWLSGTYGSVISVSPLDVVRDALDSEIMRTQTLIESLRSKTELVAGWPVGTAQVVDIFRNLLLQTSSGIDATPALDWAIADRLVPQMGQLDERQLNRASELFDDAGLANARRAVQHLLDPHGL